MSYGSGEYENKYSTPDHKYYCANCGQQIYHPYKWRNVDKSQDFTKDWEIIKSKIYIQTNENGKHIRLCDCCDKLFTTQQLIKLFLINGIGEKGREKEKLIKWNDREERKRQKAVNEFGRKIKIYELCLDCGGAGFVELSPDDYRKGCNKCYEGIVTKLISLDELGLNK